MGRRPNRSSAHWVSASRTPTRSSLWRIRSSRAVDYAQAACGPFALPCCFREGICNEPAPRPRSVFVKDRPQRRRTDCRELSREPRLEGPNFINRDFVGLNLSVALGMAMAQPGQSVIVMEGDGGLLMKLESLVTVGAKAPPNLLVLTFFNNRYVTGGGQPLLSGALNLEDFVKAARFPQTATVDSPEAFDAALDRMLDSGSLGYINVRVAHDAESDVHGSVEHENQIPPTLKMRTDFTRWIQG